MTYIPEALRRLVTERAGGRCAYCRLHEDDTFFIHEVDYIYAEKHDGPTVEGNLCIACADCNRHKGSDICSLDVETGATVMALLDEVAEASGAALITITHDVNVAALARRHYRLDQGVLAP